MWSWLIFSRSVLLISYPYFPFSRQAFQWGWTCVLFCLCASLSSARCNLVITHLSLCCRYYVSFTFPFPKRCMRRLCLCCCVVIYSVESSCYIQCRFLFPTYSIFWAMDCQPTSTLWQTSSDFCTPDHNASRSFLRENHEGISRFMAPEGGTVWCAT